MFFKRLEIFGFKSFAEKTRLDFESGVTAIVGPNGCGKTNIADAIRWVLGEQSVRSMRGTNMEDVIFHGADNIQPLGMAEVSLTISNENKQLPLEYEEITITRRIFRSGESEYLINKIPVRLKDISELLMGTGLGMSSYSLMEQGKADEVLNSRPEERRTIFEEASGITKYKAKKEEALRKLERTNENLQRVGDIIVEVKRQITSMERQVNKAHRYKEELEKLKEYELRVTQYQYQNFKKEKINIEVKIKELGHEEASLSSKTNEAVSALEKTKQELSLVEADTLRLKQKSYELIATIKTASSKISLNEERIKELTERGESLKQQISELKKKQAATGEKIKDAKSQFAAIEKNKQENLTLLGKKEEEINNILAQVKQVQKNVSLDKMQEVEVIAQQAKIKNELTKLEANLANFNARLRRLNIERERTEKELDNIEEKDKLALQEFTALNEQLEGLAKEVSCLKDSQSLTLAKKHQLEFSLEELNRRLTLLQSKVTSLLEITERYEGYSLGVKNIFSAQNNQELKIDGLLGVVADLLKVVPKYQLAIEMALGERLQAIVVENKQQAAEAINYLKTKDKGRASFICLDSLTPSRVKDVKTSLPVSWALDFVSSQPKYQRLLEYLLANTFIVQDRVTAQRVVEELDDSCLQLVTQDAEVFTKGTISGGSLTKDNEFSLLGRRERIAQTQNELDKANKEKMEIENLKSDCQAELKQITNLIQDKEPNANALRIKLANKENESSNIEAEKKRFQDEVALLQLELDETSEEIKRLQSEISGLNKELADTQGKQNELQQRILKQQNLISEQNQRRQNILVEIAALQAQNTGLEKAAEDAQVRQGMLLASCAEQAQEEEDRVQELQGIGSKIEQLNREIEELRLQEQGLSGDELNIEEQMKKTNEKRNDLLAVLKDWEERAGKSQKELYEIKEKRTAHQVRFTELNYKQDSLKERMYETYRVDLEASLENIVEISPPHDSIFTEINQLKTKLEGMGPVNLVAIEENEQLQQRYNFLISQQEDLCSAQESLRKAIVQINHTARQMFAETFQKIQVYFKESFRILFGGGDARLILMDENNILETGIEVVVRPPGKRLQNISLLSGGEKALTAIALLFAIFKVKPSPFYLLDEVDAPLDEANIDRFINLLSEFIKISQFIIITHNKKTINMADVLYGITMEKSGISKIVSVKFTEVEEVATTEEVAQVER